MPICKSAPAHHQHEDNMPLVSVIIPTCNSHRFLEHCLQSIHDQTYCNFEIIVVDNYSTDSTLETARRFKAKVLLNDGNQAAARNFGVKESQGDFILFLDSDQTVSDKLLDECVSLAKHAETVHIPETPVGTTFWSSCLAWWKKLYPKVEEARETAFGSRFFTRKSLYKVGLFNENLVWGEDLDLHMRLVAAGVKQATSSSRLSHFEPSSLRGVVRKNIRYGRSLSTFKEETGVSFYKQTCHSILVLREAVANVLKHPLTTIGCLILYFIKILAITLGMLTAKLRTI